MNRETIKQPKLVDNIHIKQEVITPKVVAPKGPAVIPKLSSNDNFKLNETNNYSIFFNNNF